MVYYSPYKQIWRAFIHAVRKFISSLFSKRLLIMIIVALVIMLLHLNVHAESIYQDGYAYRNIKFNGYNEELDTYDFEYRIYVSTGLIQGTFNMPSSLYNNSNWVLMYIPNQDRIHYYSFASGTSLYIKYVNNNLYMSTVQNQNKITFKSTYRYDLSGNVTWSYTTQTTQDNWQFNVEPNGILFSKDVNIYYCNGSTIVGSYTDLQDNRVLNVPNLRLYNGSGFRLYLKDFEPFSSSEYEDWDYDYSLIDTITVYYSIYDINNQIYQTQDSSLQLQDYDDDRKFIC